MSDVEVELFGGPRDGLVLSLDTDKILIPVDPEFQPEVLPEGTPVHVWDIPEDLASAPQPVRCRYLGERVFQ